TFEVQRTEEMPAFGGHVFFDVQTDRVSFWSGEGPVFSVPLDQRAAVVISDPAIRKTTYDLKETMLKLFRNGIELAPPYDDPMLMAYLLFPNRGKYELPDLVFEFFGRTMAPDEERTPWIDRLSKQLAPQMEQQVRAPYNEIELPLSRVLVEMEM